MEQQVKQVPYGVADFAKVMTQNLYYVDKTMFLPELEKQPRNLFFIRPRRFGKSIFLSMLYSYYDCNQKSKFEKLFGSLWIGQHPTALQGKYQVLFLDFSQITGKIDILEERFNAYLSINLDAFVRQYAQYYQEEKDEILSKTNYAANWNLFSRLPRLMNIHFILSSMNMTILQTLSSMNMVRKYIMQLLMPMDSIVMFSKSLREILSVSS